MLDVLRTSALRTNRGGPRPLFLLVVLCFLVALCFNTGLEAFGHHNHEGNGPDPNCVACRHLETPASAAPAMAAPATFLLHNPERRAPAAPGETFQSYTPAPTSLRGPPNT